jgi:hypothetical protein
VKFGGCCYLCGGEFGISLRGPTFVVRTLRGADVRLHKGCAKAFDTDEFVRPVTARESAHGPSQSFLEANT